MFTEPKIVTSNDLTKRSYVTFYFNNERVREYNGKSLQQNINPNRAKTLPERESLLKKLQYELHKALEANNYPMTITTSSVAEMLPLQNMVTETKLTTQLALDEALQRKLSADLSKFYKRNLKSIHEKFTAFLTINELGRPINELDTLRVESFLSQFGSSGTYYMNKRRDLGVLIGVAAKVSKVVVTTVKDTERRRSKAKLHKAYDKAQLKPILEYLKKHYPNLYVCCLLIYSTWLRPHEEIRLLTKGHFMNDMSEIHLSGDENKGGKVRVVYIPNYVKEVVVPIISDLKRNDNIFSRNPTPYNEAYFNTMWTRAWRKMYPLGLVYENQTPYSFRHTAAIDTYKRTKDVYLLQKLLGHSTIVVTLKYLRSLGEFSSDELRQAAPKLD